MKTNKKTGNSCEECGGLNIKTHLTTYPLKIDKKQINVDRVSVRECMDCHLLMPTKAGLDKLGRCMMTFMSFLEK
jgi:YgiT-type zinc finger domain-containing protein